jgi:hypothetical protein
MEFNGQLHATAILPQGEYLWCLLDRKLSILQSWLEQSGEEKL